MRRKTSVLEHLWQELEGSPTVPIPDLARKYSIPEGTIFEHLRSKGVAKVRRDRWDLLMEQIRSWGQILVRVRNDWAAIEFPLASDLLHVSSHELSAERDGTRVRIRFNSVESIYLLEDVPSCAPTVVFCNKKGRCVFEVSVARASGALQRFREARGLTCTG